MPEARRYPATTGRFASRPAPWPARCRRGAPGTLPGTQAVTALGPQESGRRAGWPAMACPAPTAAPGCLAHADGDSTHARVQVLTNASALDRDKQPPVVSQLTAIVAAAAGDSLAGRPHPGPATEAPTADGAWPATPPATPSPPRAARAETAGLQAPDRQLTARPAQEGNPHDHDHQQRPHGAILGASEHAGQRREQR